MRVLTSVKTFFLNYLDKKIKKYYNYLVKAFERKRVPKREYQERGAIAASPLYEAFGKTASVSCLRRAERSRALNEKELNTRWNRV